MWEVVYVRCIEGLMFPWQQRKANANVASDFVEETDVKTFNSTGVF